MNGTQTDAVSKTRYTRKSVAAQGPKPPPGARCTVLHAPRQPVLQASRRVDALIFQVQVNVRCSAWHDDLVQMRFARPIEIRLKDLMNVDSDTWEECIQEKELQQWYQLVGTLTHILLMASFAQSLHDISFAFLYRTVLLSCGK
jgi:hypothetical protein